MSSGRMSHKRIRHEIKYLENDLLLDIKAEPISDSNLFNWTGYVIGYENSPYENGRFFFKIEIPIEYPFKPPKVTFTTKIFHPNIDSNGCISLDILNKSWCPAFTISRVLVSIRALLVDGNFDEPLEPEIANLYINDRAKYQNTARDWTIRYASQS